ncbi:MAG: SoxR reducing system RseC family protein [Zoogloeaceae bacterium]|nr:SoxR reducing system RseC family protein [Zoogloeaceae bacterium]
MADIKQEAESLALSPAALASLSPSSSSFSSCSEQTGKVVALEGEYALVQVAAGGCGRCHEPGACGGQSLARIFGRAAPFRVKNACGASPGDVVALRLPAGVLTRHATLGYGLPLAGLLLGALVGKIMVDGAGEGGALAGAAFGLLSGLWALRWRSRQYSGNSRHEPYIHQIKSQEEV